VHAHSEAGGVVHKEQDLPVTHILGSKGKDHGEYSQKPGPHVNTGEYLNT